MSVVTRHAVCDPSMRAALGELAPLFYEGGADAAADHPAHVRAASGVRRWAGRLVMVQDDTLVLALRDDAGVVAPLLLPTGPDGLRVHDTVRGTKHEKMDLEACVTLPDGRFVGLGSGSTQRRERLVVVTEGEAPRVVDARAMYAALRAATEFSGTELNVEGALVTDGALRLFQRGNGAPKAGALPAHASAEFSLLPWLDWLDRGGPLPALSKITRYALGQVQGVAFGFTDAAALPDGRVAFLAAAEDSADTFRDGAVLGCIFGVIEGERVRTCEVAVEGLSRCPKLEGIEVLACEGDALRFAVVADVDAPEVPALFGILKVHCG